MLDNLLQHGSKTGVALVIVADSVMSWAWRRYRMEMAKDPLSMVTASGFELSVFGKLPVLLLFPMMIWQTIYVAHFDGWVAALLFTVILTPIVGGGFLGIMCGVLKIPFSVLHLLLYIVIPWSTYLMVSTW